MITYALIFAISSILTLVVSCYRRSKTTFPALLFSLFCCGVFGKIIGFIPAAPINQIVNQSGFDDVNLPISIGSAVGLACGLGTAFNLLTALWIYKDWSFWRWVVFSIVGFCIACSVAGSFFGIPPLEALFGGCCGFMLLVGWVFGLTYIEFCVIGNIWIPIIAIIASVSVMIYAGRSNRLVILWGVFLIIGAVVISVHYALPMHEAFFLCVADLKWLAAQVHTTYVIVNLVIYVCLIVALLAVNIGITRKYLKK